MSRQHGHLFKFGPFVLDAVEQSLTKDEEPVPLPPKALAVLLVLVRNAGRTVGKGEILQEVWPDTFVEEQNVGQNVHLLRKALSDDSNAPRYVATVARRGYRFVAHVREEHAGDVTRAVLPEGAGLRPDSGSLLGAEGDGAAAETSRGRGRDVVHPGRVGEVLAWLSSTLGEHRWFVLVSCALYALLYVVALLVEVAYQFDRYGIAAAKAAPVVFLWVWITSVAGLGAGRHLALRGRISGLSVSLSVFALAGLLLYAALGFLLPNEPITRAQFQTYPAHGAYLKSVYYFLPLAVVFLILPYHFVVATRKDVRAGRRRQTLALLAGRRTYAAPAGTIYVKGRWLAITLALAAVAAVVATAHLLENLVPGEHKDFFTQLVEWRLALYFALGLMCLVWYSRALDEIKRECLNIRAAVC